MKVANDTQRVLLSEAFEDDLYYTTRITIVRTEVVFNRESIVFVKLANDGSHLAFPLGASEIETFITAYTAFQHEQEIERAISNASAFRAWLEVRRDQDQHVGSSNAGPSCPVALWLSDLYGTPYRAADGVYGPVETNEEYPAPWWMREFVAKLDAEPRVSALDAIYALNALDAVIALEDLDAHPF